MLWRNPHRRFQERLSAYLDGELPPDDAPAVQSHIESCGSCAEELAEIRLASAALAQLPEVEAPRSFALTPEDAARPAVMPQTIRSVNSGLRLTGGALAAALAVLLVLDFGGVVGDGQGQDNGGATGMQREAAFGATGASESPVAPAPGAADGAGTTQEDAASASPEPEASTPPPAPVDRDEAAVPPATPTPAPDDLTGDAAAALELNGSEGEDTETFAPEVSTTEDDDGLSALTVTEIVLAALLGALVIGIGAATYAGRRRG